MRARFLVHLLKLPLVQLRRGAAPHLAAEPNHRAAQTMCGALVEVLTHPLYALYMVDSPTDAGRTENSRHARFAAGGIGTMAMSRMARRTPMMVSTAPIAYHRSCLGLLIFAEAAARKRGREIVSRMWYISS